MPSLTLRNTKGSELTYTEVDNNFIALNTTVSATLTAAGSTQGTATAITSTVTFITSAAAGTGVILPAPDAAEKVTLVNHATAPVNIYPAVGHTIDAMAANAPLVLPPGCAVDLIGTTASNWTGMSVDIWDDENNVLVIPKHPSIPPSPPAGYVGLFAKSQANRHMPAFIGPSGLDSVLQPHMAKNGWAQWKPAGTGTTISAIGAAALTAVGTATAATYATTSLHTRSARIDYLVTTAATTAVAGFRIATNAYRVTDGFQMIFRVAPATGGTVATRRFFCGMSTSTAAPTDVDPSTLTNSCGAGYSNADTNWQLYFGGTAVAKVDTGIPKPSTDRPGPYTVIVFAPPGGGYIACEIVDEATGTSFESLTTTSTNIIAATTACGPRGYHSVGGTSSVVGFTLFSGYMETDN